MAGLRRSDEDFRREIEAHIALEADRLVAEGLDPEDARAAAVRRFGNVARVQEAFYESRRIMWLDDLRRDARHAARTFLRTPGFTIVAIVALALAIGLNSAIFSVVDGVLLRPLRFPHAGRLVRLFESNAAANRPRTGGSPANFIDWRKTTAAFDALTAIGDTSITLTGAAEPEVLIAMAVSPDFFAVTGVVPVVGRIFEPPEYESVANAALGPIAPREKVTGDATVLISEALWKRQFGSDPHIAGRHVALNGMRARIIGVLPAHFRFDQTPRGTADCWLPMVESRVAEHRRFRQLMIVGRLKPGVEISAAQAEMSVIASRLADEHPRDNAGWTVQVTPLQESLVGGARRLLLILFGGVGCVLLIACSNVAGLLLMRAEGRPREVAVRMALGAGRGRLVRQWLTESLLLAILGGVAGLAVARWAVPALIALAPPDLPRMSEVAVDTRILLFTAGASLMTGILCGLAPAFGSRFGNGRYIRALRSTGVAAVGPRRRWLREALVIAQVALAIVLLVGAGLMARTMMVLNSVDLGFDPANVLTFGVNLRGERYQGLEKMRAFSRDLVARLEAIPGVEAAGVGSVPLLGGLSTRFRIEHREEPIPSRMDVPSPGYFRALGIRVRYGRLFLEHDRTSDEQVAIVNRAFARAAWGTENVVGRRLRGDQSEMRWMTVVGVVEDLRMASLEAEAPPVVFVPDQQSTIATFSNYVVRVSGDPLAILPTVRDTVRALDPALALTRIATMDERVARAIRPRAFNLWLIGLFSMVALVLAIVGVYGLISESVARRTSEIGVRMALGARRGEVVRIVLARSLSMTAIGILVGLGAAASVGRYVEAMVFGLEPLDPATFAIVPVVFIAAAAIAALVPARRATTVNPVIALRCE